MENARPHKRAPTSVNVTVGRRSREYLTEREVERLIESAKQNRSGHRDATAILVAYRHGLRASELVALRWDDVDVATGATLPANAHAKIKRSPAICVSTNSNRASKRPSAAEVCWFREGVFAKSWWWPLARKLLKVHHRRCGA